MRNLNQLTLCLLLLSLTVSGENIINEDLGQGGNFNETIHVNTNDFIGDTEGFNDSLSQPPSQPELSVTVENPESKPRIPKRGTQPEPSNDYQNANGEKYLSEDSYSLHISGFHPQEKISPK